MKRSLFAMLVSLVVLLAASLPASAAPVGLAGLMVELQQSGWAMYSATTSADGTFVMPAVEAGTYSMVAWDPADGLRIQITLNVPAPIDVTGLLTDDPDAAVGLSLYAWLGPMPEPEPPPVAGLAIDAIALRPRKWSPNYSHSMGRVHVSLWGAGLDQVESVTLRSEAGEITSTDIVLDPIEGTAVAGFSKGAAWEALIPDGAARGAVVPVTIILSGAAGESTFDAEIVVGPGGLRRKK